MTNTESILTFEDVGKVYNKGEKDIYALKNVSLSLKPNTITLITGPAGSGKTTLIYLAGLIKEPSSGEININGTKTGDLNENERSELIRENIGFIFRRSNLLPHLSILENVMLPMISAHAEKAGQLLEMVGITDWDRYPCDLSFQEEQKVALARALSNDPVLILADEPTGELDSEETKSFIKILHELSNIAILITSDYDFPQEAFDQRFKLKEGIIKPELSK